MYWIQILNGLQNKIMVSKSSNSKTVAMFMVDNFLDHWIHLEFVRHGGIQLPHGHNFALFSPHTYLR